MSSMNTPSALNACIACGSSELWLYLDLGYHPPSNDFLTRAALHQERKYPLGVQLCRACGLSQLTHLVPPSEIFSDYAYLASSSRPLTQHYNRMIADILERFSPPPGAVCVDIGANDGITLAAYPSGRYRVLGIEPSSAARAAREKGFTIINRFIDDEAAASVLKNYGAAHVITATNVLAHIPDLPQALACVQACLHAEGVFVAEFPYYIDTMEGLYFDTIYHEHVSYLTLTPLMKMLNGAGLKLFDAVRIEFGASGPALRIFCCHASDARRITDGLKKLLDEERTWGVTETEPYEHFARKVSKVKTELCGLIEHLLTRGHRIGVMSAPAKGNTLLNYCALDHSELIAVAENNERKIGRLTPGSHIPIVSDKDFLGMSIEYALLLSWNYADYFLQHSEFAKRGGKFIIPLPAPHISPEKGV